MGAGEIIAIFIITFIISGAVVYMIKAKKSGKKCIGCPDCCSCKKKKGKQQSKDTENECCRCSKDD